MKVKDHFFSQEEFQIIPSRYKGILKTSPGLREEELSSYYNPNTYISHQTQANSLLDKIYHLAKRIMIARKQKTVLSYHSSGKILDIGTGTGDFLNAFDTKQWTKFAIEPNSKLHPLLLKNEISIYSDLNSIEEQKFDVITLWHVLEHIPNLEKTLEQIQSLLKPQGVLIIAVPNFKSYDAVVYKQYWAAWDVPRHVWHFSKKGLISLCAKFNLSFVKLSPLLLDAFYISIVSERYRNSNNLLRAFCIGFYSNLYALFKKEYSSFLYVFKQAK